MSTTKVLLLGGHGRVALYLTPLLLNKNWHVTSVVRNNDHKQEILDLGKNQKGKIDVLLESLEDVKDVKDARKVLESVKPEIVVWAAGAGGKGGASRTYAIDRDAAKHYIAASVSLPSIKKFLMISYIASRHGRAPWWTEEDFTAKEKTNSEALPDYFKAKVAADEFLLYHANQRKKNGDKTFQDINLRPGTLSDEEGSGKVSMGKIGYKGSVSREDVARVAAELLGRNDTRGWYDLLSGEEEIPTAVERVVAEGIDAVEGEDLERILKNESL